MILKQQWFANKLEVRYTLYGETQNHDNSSVDLTYGPKYV